MEIIKVKDYDEMSQKACEMMVSHLKKNEQTVLGLATGSTPEGLYANLIEENKKGNISFKNTITFNLDEYVGLDEHHSQSYRYFMNDKLFDHIDIPKENTHVPSGVSENPEKTSHEYELLIKQAGGIDFQVLGLGLNGHIGFNEPGTSFTSRTHVVELDKSTREANARFFNSIDEVPTKAVTMGIETIMESKEILLLVSGKNKAEAVARLINGEVSEDFPASILQKHKNVTIIADEEALSKTNLE